MTKESRLVVKDNALVEACFNLSLTEQRMMMLGIVSAREQTELTPDTPIEITASAFMEQYEIDSRNAYKQLSNATKTLFNRQFSFVDRYKDTHAITVSRWVNEVKYVEDRGMVVMYLNRNVIQMITRLESHFTKYHLKQVSHLTSQYSVRLFELLSQWLSNHVTKKYSTQELRMLLGIEPHEYKTMSNFKSRVIDNAVTEITEKTNLSVTYQQFKEGRTISHIQFKMKLKDEPQQPQKLKPMTDKQIAMYADKLSNSQSFQNHFSADTGQTADAYSKKIATKLQDTFYQNEWLPFLLEVGFKPKYTQT